MGKWLLQFSILIFAAKASADGPSCISLFSRYSSESFWRSEAAALVHVEGKEYPLTFSLDSEVASGYLLPWATKIPALQRLVDKIYKGQSLLLSEIAGRLGMSEAQVKSFVLRPHTDLTKFTFNKDDVKPSYLQDVFDAPRGLEKLSEFWEKHLRRLGYPLRAHVDQSMVEFTHESYSKIPAEFKSLEGQFHAQFPKANTHFHVGIPAEIGWQKSLAIARAVETRIVLLAASHWPSQAQELFFNHGTTLNTRKSFIWKTRGVIRYQWKEWAEPHWSSNLEIRQWSSRQEAFELLYLASTLAMSHQKIILPQMDRTLTSTHDLYVGNVVGALQYAAVLLAHTKKPEDMALAMELRQWAIKVAQALKDRVKYSVAVDESLKNEVAHFLRAHRIVERLEPELFLD